MRHEPASQAQFKVSVEFSKRVVDGEVGAEQAEQGGSAEHGQGFDGAEAMQGELGAVGGGELVDVSGEAEACAVDHGPAGEAAEQALQGAVVKEGPADETVGGADQPGNFDLLAQGVDLQADGVAGDGGQGQAEQAGEHPDQAGAEAYQCRQAFCPIAVEADVIDGGAFAYLGRQGFHGGGVGVLRGDAQGMRQGIVVQAGEQIAQPAFLQGLEALFAADEGYGGDAGAGLQGVGQFARLGFVDADFQEDGDFGVGGRLSGQALEIVQGDIEADRQAEGDADDQDAERGGEGGFAEALQGQLEAVPVVREPDFHSLTLPASRVRQRPP